MKPRTFKHFPPDAICPVCGTDADEECVLIPIYGTQKDNLCEAQPFHLGCAVANIYNKNVNLIYRWCKHDIVEDK